MATSQKIASTNKYYWKQSSFAGGEFSPDVYARDDMTQYAIGMKELTNFIPRPFGGVYNRTGTKYINATKNSGNYISRLVPFVYNENYSYVLEFGNYYIRVYKNGGIVESNGSPVEITTPWPASVIFGLRFTQSADTLYICNRDYATRTLVRNSDTSWTLSKYEFTRGPFRTQNSEEITLTPSGISGSITVTASANVFNSGMVGGLLEISQEVYGQSVSYQNQSAAFTSSPLKCNGDWNFQLTDPYRATFTIQISNDNGSTWKTLKSYGATDGSSAISDSGSTDHFCLLRLIGTASQDGSGSLSLNCASFVNDGILTITGYTSATQVTASVYTSSNDYMYGLADTTATETWSIGAWSDYCGYPSCANFFQDRLCFASTNKDPLGWWASQTGDYGDFYVHPDPKDDDSISETLASGKANDIQHMLSMDSLLCFTYGSEWKINSGSSKSAITPSAINASQQSGVGASTIPPIVINDRALYCSYLGNKVLDFSYDYNSDTFKASDQTLFSRHLFKEHSIVDWCYQDSPDNIVWLIRDDGVLLSFTYIYDQKVAIWSKHETDGKFESCACIPGDTQDEVYFIVKRTVNGSTVRYVEMLHEQDDDDIKNQFYVDCGLSLDTPLSITAITNASPCTITSASHGLSSGDYVEIFDAEGMTELNDKRFIVGTVTTNTFTLLDLNSNAINSTDYGTYTGNGNAYKCVTSISGLDHLRGKTVAVVGDGSYMGEFTVSSSGSVTLNHRAAIIHAGLPYTAQMQTLDIQIPRQDGTSRTRKKRMINPVVDVAHSYGGAIGINNYDNMENMATQMGTYFATPPSLFTGKVKTEPMTDVEDDASITVRQTIPLPLNILAITAAVNMP
jgi:hypothetical protein